MEVRPKNETTHEDCRGKKSSILCFILFFDLLLPLFNYFALIGQLEA